MWNSQRSCTSSTMLRLSRRMCSMDSMEVYYVDGSDAFRTCWLRLCLVSAQATWQLHSEVLLDDRKGKVLELRQLKGDGANLS
eukprot:1655919-Amphidinium_carterae.2